MYCQKDTKYKTIHGVYVFKGTAIAYIYKLYKKFAFTRQTIKFTSLYYLFRQHSCNFTCSLVFTEL